MSDNKKNNFFMVNDEGGYSLLGMFLIMANTNSNIRITKQNNSKTFVRFSVG